MIAFASSNVTNDMILQLNHGSAHIYGNGLGTQGHPMYSSTTADNAAVKGGAPPKFAESFILWLFVSHAPLPC